jgi:polysaccharide biosynthesis/export protein
MRKWFTALVFTALLPALVSAEEPGLSSSVQQIVSQNEYDIGVEDVLEISVLQPEHMSLTVTVTPDGAITFPYIGNITVRGRSPSSVQKEIQERLADGYLKYPVVSVAVKQCRSKKFYIYGEVEKPGAYLMEDNMTVLKALAGAGGLSKYGSLRRVQILRPKKNSSGYETRRVDMAAIMSGKSIDIYVEPGDIIKVKEGVF